MQKLPDRSDQNVLLINDLFALYNFFFPIIHVIGKPLPRALPNIQISGLTLYFKCSPPRFL